jgi:uncharacterized protein YbbC (DUF1343 family)
MIALRLAFILLFACLSAGARVKTGLDVLIEQNFAPLQGKRVGIITNQTGRTEDGRRIIDVIAHAPGVRLTAIFSPEHGLEGVRQDRNIGDGVDEATGVPVYSLYNEGRYRPTPEMLKNVDVLVYDIEQNGARFLTRITTLGYTMEAAAQNHIPFYVLDRPNGINGVDFGGPRLDAKYVSFVGYLPGLPIRHGMTAGELAQMYNGEKKLGVDLHVIRMEGWKRNMWYDDTGLEWVNPSPNIRSLTAAILYPGMCLLESKEVSVGRGTDTPFQIFGAPWYRAREVAGYLNERVPGVRFVPRVFKPNASVYKDQECQGVDVTLVNRDAFDPVLMGLELLAATLKFHPGKFDLDGVMRLLGNDEAAARLKRGESGRQVLDAMRTQTEEFARIRAKYLLYEGTAQAQPQNPSPMVEHTRAHPRLEHTTPEGRREKLALGTLFIPANLNLKSPAPLLFFFHGSTWVPEVAAGENGTAVVSIQIGSGSRAYIQPFLDPKFFGNLLQEAESKAGVKFSPITLAGWSAGCGAIRQIMSTPEYYDRIANTILIDGIHTGYVTGQPGPLESEINTDQLQIFVRMARDAIAGKRRMIITHSEIFPGTFASTTETADYILGQLGLKRQPVLKWGPMQTQELSEVRAGGFLLVGFAGNSAPDHVDQLHSLPEYLKWLK